MENFYIILINKSILIKLKLSDDKPCIGQYNWKYYYELEPIIY